jgi:hypothetical protein
MQSVHKGHPSSAEEDEDMDDDEDDGIDEITNLN